MGRTYKQGKISHRPANQDRDIRDRIASASLTLLYAGSTCICRMSLATIARYCRFADLKLSGQAALPHLKRNRTLREQDCKTVENCKT
jgi:hypothetical protein